MPDHDLKMWLIEVNKCPSMECSTPVTSLLVPQFCLDLVNLLTVDKSDKLR